MKNLNITFTKHNHSGDIEVTSTFIDGNLISNATEWIDWDFVDQITKIELCDHCGGTENSGGCTRVTRINDLILLTPPYLEELTEETLFPDYLPASFFRNTGPVILNLSDWKKITTHNKEYEDKLAHDLTVGDLFTSWIYSKKGNVHLFDNAKDTSFSDIERVLQVIQKHSLAGTSLGIEAIKNNVKSLTTWIRNNYKSKIELELIEIQKKDQSVETLYLDDEDTNEWSLFYKLDKGLALIIGQYRTSIPVISYSGDILIQ